MWMNKNQNKKVLTFYYEFLYIFRPKAFLLFFTSNVTHLTKKQVHFFPTLKSVSTQKEGTMGCLLTSPQSFTIMFSYSLVQQLWGLLLSFN